MGDVDSGLLDAVLIGPYTFKTLAAAELFKRNGLKFKVILRGKSCQRNYLSFNPEAHLLTNSLVSQLEVGKQVVSSNFLKWPSNNIPKLYQDRYFYSWRHPFLTLDMNHMFRTLDKMAFNLSCSCFSVDDDSETFGTLLRRICWTSFTRKFASTLCSDLFACGVDEVSAFWMLWVIRTSGGCTQLFFNSRCILSEETLAKALDLVSNENTIILEDCESIKIESQENEIDIRVNGSALRSKFVFLVFNINELPNFLQFPFSEWHKLYLNQFSSSIHALSENTLNIENDVFNSVKRVFDPSQHSISYIYKNSHISKGFKLPTKMENLDDCILTCSNTFFVPGAFTNGFLEFGYDNSLPRIVSLDSCFSSRYPAHLEGTLSMANECIHLFKNCSLLSQSSMKCFQSKRSVAVSSFAQNALNLNRVFRFMPSITHCLWMLFIYLGLCSWFNLRKEIKEVATLLYVYYRFDSWRENRNQPTAVHSIFTNLPVSKRFNRFLKFLNLFPTLKNGRSITSGEKTSSSFDSLDSL